MEGANFLNDQFGEVLAGRKLLDFLPRYDDHFDAERGHLDAHQEVGSGQMLRLAGDPACRDQDPESHAAMPDFRQKPGDLFAINGVPPSLAFHEKEINQGSKPCGMVFVFAGDVDLLRRECVHLVARGDRDAGNAVQEVAGQILERLALRRVGRRVVDDSPLMTAGLYAAIG
jgi:hypothetical protein